MITSSFRHIGGVGPLRERQLWLRGIASWDAMPDGPVLADKLDEKLRRGIAESRAHLAAGDCDHFARALPVTEHWRLLPQLLDGAGFLDIECTDGGEVTVIGVMDARGIRSFVGDLDEFPARAAAWKCLVTFNGCVFDLPHLRRKFPSWVPPAAHVDLQHVFRKLKMKGGLKQLEQRLGFFRPPHLSQLSPTDVAWLWQARRRGDPSALRRLVEYNLYDVFHLKPLAELGYNLLLKRTRMPARELPVTDRSALLYDVSRAVDAAAQI